MEVNGSQYLTPIKIVVKVKTMVDRTVLTGSCQSKYGGSVWGGGYEETQSIYTTWPNLFGGFGWRQIPSKNFTVFLWF